MKKESLFSVVCLTVLFVFPCLAAPVDPERAADAFVQLDITQYEGWFGFTRVLPDGATEEITGNFTLLLDGRIPRLEINGEEIVSWSDEPLAGLPVNKVGSATNFWLQLNGWDGSSSEYVTYGYCSQPLLLPSDVIAVEINLSWQENFLPYETEELVASRLVLQIGDAEFAYDESRGGFVYWSDPAEDVDYLIVDSSTRQVIARGSVDSGLSEANAITTSLEGGVRELFPAERNNVYWRNQWFSSLERDGEWLPAQVYIARAYGQAIYIEPNSFTGRVEVYSLDEGERVLIVEREISESGRVAVPVGYDRLVIELISAPEGAWTNFNLWASRASTGGKG